MLKTARTPASSFRLSIQKAGRHDAGSSVASFARAVREGLLAERKTLPCQYFYDEQGSLLFEQICDLPEYYLTRVEDAILAEHADAMVDGSAIGAPVIVELGSGSSTKTRRLIDAAISAHGTLHYIPIDVSPSILEESAEALIGLYPTLRITAHAATYQDALLGAISRIERPKLLVFLGSSLGNYRPDEAVELLRLIAQAMGPADGLLLGTDMVKDPRLLEAAYDDAQGVTARFNLNLLERINRELDGQFDLEAFEHRAVWNPVESRIEMHLVSRIAQTVAIPGADAVVEFQAGETIHTENSHKYTPDLLADLARRAGLVEEARWTDPKGWFQLQRWVLAR